MELLSFSEKFVEMRTISELMSGVEVALKPIVAESAFLVDAEKHRISARLNHINNA